MISVSWKQTRERMHDVLLEAVSCKGCGFCQLEKHPCVDSEKGEIEAMGRDNTYASLCFVRFASLQWFSFPYTSLLKEKSSKELLMALQLSLAAFADLWQFGSLAFFFAKLYCCCWFFVLLFGVCYLTGLLVFRQQRVESPQETTSSLQISTTLFPYNLLSPLPLVSGL